MKLATNLFWLLASLSLGSARAQDLLAVETAQGGEYAKPLDATPSPDGPHSISLPQARTDPRFSGLPQPADPSRSSPPGPPLFLPWGWL